MTGVVVPLHKPPCPCGGAGEMRLTPTISLPAVTIPCPFHIDARPLATLAVWLAYPNPEEAA